MPGGRLSYQDREAIAAGLADGLSHAEIARRLDRPTSTVSREVHRNGGPAGYDAGLAHQATGRRAQRRHPAAAARGSAAVPAIDSQAPAGDPASAPGGRDPAAVRKYQEWLTEVLIQMGLTRMTAAVLTCLTLTDSGRLTAAELVRQLGVSPASISKAVSFLEEQGLVRRERVARHERYIVDDDFWFRAWMVSAQTNARLADAAMQGTQILGAGTPAGKRLGEMGQFLRLVGDDMLRAAEHWWNVVTGGGARPGERS